MLEVLKVVVNKDEWMKGCDKFIADAMKTAQKKKCAYINFVTEKGGGLLFHKVYPVVVNEEAENGRSESINKGSNSRKK